MGLSPDTKLAEDAQSHPGEIEVPEFSGHDFCHPVGQLHGGWLGDQRNQSLALHRVLIKT